MITASVMKELKILSCVFRIKLFFEVFVSFASMSYNLDTGIKDPHFSLII